MLFLCTLVVQSGLQGRSPGSVPRWERSPREGNGKPLPGKLHGQRSLVGYSPCGYQESDTAEQLTFHASIAKHNSIGKNFSTNHRLKVKETHSSFYCHFIDIFIDILEDTLRSVMIT